MSEVNKLFAVELSLTAIVWAADRAEAEEIARDEQRDIVRDASGDFAIRVAQEIKERRQLSLYGWDVRSLPYGHDGNTRIEELLPLSISKD